MNKNRFSRELSEGVRRAYLSFRKEVQGETIYGFSLCLTPMGSYVGAYGTTEERLDQVVAKYQAEGLYRARKGVLKNHLRASLRWNCADDWLFIDDPYFTKANKTLRPAFETNPDPVL